MSAPFRSLLAPTDRMLRQFAALWILFFGALAAWQEFQQQRSGLALFLMILAVTVGPLGLIWPRAIRVIFIAWMAAAYPIGWVISRVVLGTIYYGLITPMALTFRLMGRDALQLKKEATSRTYWRPKPRPAEHSQYLRQY